MNKIFVYDTTRGFARFIKLYFSEKYTISTCTLKKKLEYHNLKEYKIAFVVINEYEELVHFLQMKLKVRFVFVASNIPEIRDLVSEMEGICFLDLKKIKKQILVDIEYNLINIKLY